MTEDNKTPDLATTVADKLAKDNDADIILINSIMKRGLDEQLFSLLESTHRRQHVFVILVTPGGDPDAAYRISKLLQTCYSKFTMMVASYCKSAGTLVALGAHELVMSDIGELGPLDVQISKKDELGELSSGLIAAEALTVLQKKAFEMFEQYFITIKQHSEGQITFKTATEIAVKLTVGLLEPVYTQIDPIQVGEIARSMKIGLDYGKRLAIRGKNLKSTTLRTLTETYPSHGFVIDRDEATNLFKNVRAPSLDEKMLIDALGDCAINLQQGLSARFVSTPVTNTGDKHDESSSGVKENGKTKSATRSVSKGNAKNPRRTGKTEPPDNGGSA